MKKNIEKHFLLLIFIFVLSLVNITSIFALGKTADILPSVKKFITKGVDTEACKRNASKTGLAQYSETCRKQCTSKDAKYTKFKADNKKACDFLAAAGGTSGTGGTGTPDAAAQPAVGGTGGTGGTDTKTENSSLIEDYIKNADLSTKEAFDKIKEVFDVTVERIPRIDFLPFIKTDEIFSRIIEFLGLVPVRVTITPKAVDLDATKQVLLEELLTQRILALAAKAPTTLGEDANEHADPAPGSLYELIYKGAVAGLDKIVIAHINTKPNVTIELKFSTVGAIVNTAKVIAVRKGPFSDTIDILLELDAPGYISGFEKLSGVTFSYAHIADPAATGAAFVAPENFVAGLVPGTEAKTDCPVANTLFVDRLNDYFACRNLLKITVPTATTAEFGIPDAPLLDSGDSAAHIQAAAQAAKTVGPTIVKILNLGIFLKRFSYHFDPDIAAVEDHYLYASDAIRDQLKNSRNILSNDVPSHYWPAQASVQAAIATLSLQNWPAQASVQAAIATVSLQSVVFLLRVAGDLKSVYLTKKINAPVPVSGPGN